MNSWTSYLRVVREPGTDEAVCKQDQITASLNPPSGLRL